MRRTSVFCTILLLGGLALLIATAVVPAQLPTQPAVSPKYRAILRYHIAAPRDQHVLQYDAMIEHLAGLGFQFDPPLGKRPETDREDRSKNRMKGTIEPEKARPKDAAALTPEQWRVKYIRRLLDNVSIASLMLLPEGFKLEEGQPAYVRLELPSGLATNRQRELFEQVRALLGLQQFREAVGYDHRGYTGKPFTRLVGTVPAVRLDNLLKDLRGQPGGWLAPVISAQDLPLPLRAVSPLRLIEVLSAKDELKVFAEPEPRTPDYLEKISAELWELVKNPEAVPGRIRVQVAFVGILGDQDNSWRRALAESVPGLFIEGHVGQFATGLIPAAQLKTLASLQSVSSIRLPRLSRVDADPAIKLPGENAKVLAQSGVATLHERGSKGKGVKLGIVDVDFRGWEKLVKAGKLPASTRIVDLTRERDIDLVPAAFPGEPDQPGHGTLCAQAAVVAAPAAEIVLVRTDGIAPYQLREIARYVQGGNYSPNIEVRRDDIVLARAGLRVQRDILAKERERLLNNFNDETDLRSFADFIGEPFGWLYSERSWHLSRMRHHEKLEQDLVQRDQRLKSFLQSVDSLHGIDVIASPLLWSDGFPLGGLSPLSRAFEQNAAALPLWFQSVGNKRGQCWMGNFHSLAGQSVMDFDAVPPKGRWSTELNFLAWQPYRAERQPDLPEKAQLRFTVQWREPHDPDYFLRSADEDYYRRPLATLKLLLLRQRDSEAKAVPADLFEVIAQSVGLPQRLEHQPGGSTYEIALEVTVDKPGRYALRVEKQADSRWIVGLDPTTKQPSLGKLEGLNPVGIRPLTAPVLPAVADDWELRPRIFVETIDDTVRLQGRTVFADFATEAGTVGMPGDSRGLISVGAAGLDGKARPETAVGSMPFVELSQRPTLLAYDALQLDGGTALGSSVATAYAAGTAATLLSAGVPRERLRAWLNGLDGKVLRVPAK
jgi:hypothetical protein